MKNLKLFFVTGSSFIFIMATCQKAQDHTACITACNAKEDLVITKYEHCLNAAWITYNNDLHGIKGVPGCDAMAGDAEVNCRQTAVDDYHENIRICKKIFDHDFIEARKCVVHCIQADVNERTN